MRAMHLTRELHSEDLRGGQAAADSGSQNVPEVARSRVKRSFHAIGTA